MTSSVKPEVYDVAQRC